MDLKKTYVLLIILSAGIGISCGDITGNNIAYGANETWIKSNQTNVYMTNLIATIHVCIKNNNDHVEYFKISHTYTDSLTTPINWTIVNTDPKASTMIDAVSPQFGGDLGWKINPGETKEVTFTVKAVGNSTNTLLKFFISNLNAQENIYWPLIPDPGLYSSWFQPNEIEVLNPNLDLKSWKGQFSFNLVNTASSSVSGIIRAPIVPTDSKLISQSPKQNAFADKNLVANANIAAWDVTIGSESQHYEYAYLWPSDSSSPSGTGKATSTIPKTSAASTPSIPTPETGLPYGLFVIGGVLAAGGLIYARFIK